MFFKIFLNGTSDGSLVFSHENFLLANLLYCGQLMVSKEVEELLTVNLNQVCRNGSIVSGDTVGALQDKVRRDPSIKDKAGACSSFVIL